MKMWAQARWNDTEHVIEVRNPFDQSLIDTVPRASSQFVTECISFAATYDFRLSAWERYEVLRKVHDGLIQRQEEFAVGIAKESGKTIRDARTEVARSIQTFLLSAEEAKRINGEVLPIDALPGLPKRLGIVIREPIGIVVAIGPFNYPLNLLAHKVGPAIAANNPVIVKPASSTPLTAMRMAELFIDAGLPSEMLQVVTGAASEISDALVGDPRVRKVSFTGSVPVGKALCSKLGMKAVCMELGGNDPLIVLEDADLANCAPIAVTGAFGNNGERCTSVKRLLVQESIADAFIEKCAALTERLVVGDQLLENTDIGPLIDVESAVDIADRVARSVEQGARLVCGGRQDGALLWPTLLDRVTPDMPVVADETFGPIAPVIRVRDLDHAIRIANDSPFALHAGIFTQDLEHAIKAAKQIQAGSVMINQAPGFRAEHLPFGGNKDSGLGREGVKYAVEAMTTLKTVLL